jgi:hypothetical protein
VFGQVGLVGQDEPVIACDLEMAVLEYTDRQPVVVVRVVQGRPGAVDRERAAADVAAPAGQDPLVDADDRSVLNRVVARPRGRAVDVERIAAGDAPERVMEGGVAPGGRKVGSEPDQPALPYRRRAVVIAPAGAMN